MSTLVSIRINIKGRAAVDGRRLITARARNCTLADCIFYGVPKDRWLLQDGARARSNELVAINFTGAPKTQTHILMKFKFRISNSDRIFRWSRSKPAAAPVIPLHPLIEFPCSLNNSAKYICRNEYYL